jgi:glycosyltransferase involved in cell wall biosynthesis
MTPECYPGFFPYGNPHFQKKEWFDNSDLIISVSDSSAADLLDFNPALAGRLQTIHLGSAFASYDVSQIETGLHRDPYFLYVGTRSSYKNWLQLLRAMGRCAETVGLPSLICAGGGAATESECELVHQFGLTGCVHFMSPDDQELAALYAGAAAVLVPSLAEGFSLPLVEALAFDVPVICSDIPVHQEIGAGFCTFLSPHHTHAWTDLIAAFNSLKSPSQLLGEDYQAKVDYYSFDRCVEAHRLAYASL